MVSVSEPPMIFVGMLLFIVMAAVVFEWANYNPPVRKRKEEARPKILSAASSSSLSSFFCVCAKESPRLVAILASAKTSACSLARIPRNHGARFLGLSPATASSTDRTATTPFRHRSFHAPLSLPPEDEISCSPNRCLYFVGHSERKKGGSYGRERTQVQKLWRNGAERTSQLPQLWRLHEGHAHAKCSSTTPPLDYMALAPSHAVPKRLEPAECVKFFESLTLASLTVRPARLNDVEKYLPPDRGRGGQNLGKNETVQRGRSSLRIGDCGGNAFKINHQERVIFPPCGSRSTRLLWLFWTTTEDKLIKNLAVCRFAKLRMDNFDARTYA